MSSPRNKLPSGLASRLGTKVARPAIDSPISSEISRRLQSRLGTKVTGPTIDSPITSQLSRGIQSRLGTKVTPTINEPTVCQISSGLASRLGTRAIGINSTINSTTSTSIRNNRREERKQDSASARFRVQNKNRPLFDPLQCLKLTVNNLRTYALSIWKLWELVFVPAVEEFVYNKIKFDEQKKINMDPIQLVDIAKDILQKEGWDFAFIDQLSKQVVDTRNSWAHFGFSKNLSLLYQNTNNTIQEIKTLSEFLRLISAEDAAENLECQWDKILNFERNMDNTEIIDNIEYNSPRVQSFKFTVLFEYYVSASIEEFLFENEIIYEKDSILLEQDPFRVLKSKRSNQIFKRKGLDESEIKTIYNNVREARNFAFHPGSTENLISRQNTSYSNHLILLKEALIFMDKKDEAEMMMGSGKKLLPFMIPTVEKIPTIPDSASKKKKTMITFP